MKAVNLFLLSREVPEAVHQEFECALSGRSKPIKYRPEEMELIRDMGRAFIKHGAPADVYDVGEGNVRMDKRPASFRGGRVEGYGSQQDVG